MIGPVLDPSDDFPLIFDGVETISLLRITDDADVTTVDGALRHAETSTDRPVGAVPDCDVRWHFSTVSITGDPPAPGDVIVDSTDRRWTIYAVDTSAVTGRYTCLARDLVRAYRLDRRLAIERATYAKSASGVAEAAWSTAAVVDGRICTILIEPTVGDRPVSGGEYEIVLADSPTLSTDYRIRDEQGVVYRILRASRTDDSAALPTVVAKLWDDA